MKESPIDPCGQCLVKVMCREPCDILHEYIGKVIELAVADLKHPVLDQFPLRQRQIVENAARIYRRNREKDAN